MLDLTHPGDVEAVPPLEADTPADLAVIALLQFLALEHLDQKLRVIRMLVDKLRRADCYRRLVFKNDQSWHILHSSSGDSRVEQCLWASF
jgi:hypothetical protein